MSGVDPNLELAFERAAEFLRKRPTIAGALARFVTKTEHKDRQLVEHLIRERRRKTRMDGSVDGSFVRTAWTAWDLLELGCPPDHAAVVRTVGFLLSKQNQPGRFGELCSDEEHAAQRCQHFVRGFFSPGSRDQAIAPLAFPSGLTVASEDEARSAMSCFALRVVLRAGEDRRESVRSHLDSLPALIDGSADLAIFALGALSLAPPPFKKMRDDIAAKIFALQSPSGEWRDVDLFHLLDALLAIPTPAMEDRILRTVPVLCALQRAGGAFDSEEHEGRALIALRTLSLARRLHQSSRVDAQMARSARRRPALH